LLARIGQGDDGALLELYERYESSIYRFAWQMSADSSIADDVTQEVFLMLLERRGRLARRFSRFDPAKGNLEGYLLGVARRLIRKQQWRERLWMPFEKGIDETLQSSAEDDPDSRFAVDRLRRTIAFLPVRYREALVLCCLQERSYKEAATIAGCSPGTVASRLSRARKLLERRMYGAANTTLKRTPDSADDFPAQEGRKKENG
jgi:RNA polymerase sigma-70 factor (ECF subfamily)